MLISKYNVTAFQYIAPNLIYILRCQSARCRVKYCFLRIHDEYAKTVPRFRFDYPANLILVDDDSIFNHYERFAKNFETSLIVWDWNSRPSDRKSPLPFTYARIPHLELTLRHAFYRGGEWKKTRSQTDKPMRGRFSFRTHWLSIYIWIYSHAYRYKRIATSIRRCPLWSYRIITVVKGFKVFFF